ncbi:MULTISPECIES: heparin-sulfate lyase HepC [Flavobacterium]|uniref:heparin-sulfate lyase HepC n=1 Tax=Flavobacterium TaxID=237 RepID=UPI001182CEEA|nr:MULTISPECIES: heparin-sulfate lyase HepC [Flavobacterium]MCR4033783.1 heparinase II/III family protein [Flavobacterium panacis]
MRLVIKTFVFLFVLLLMQKTIAQEVKITKSSFNAINLDRKGLEKVKKLVASAKYKEAANQLLHYYRNRTDVKHLDFNPVDLEKLKGKKVNENTLELANNILKHQFKPHKGYPAYDYGQDINWQYRPVQDQLLTTFLHRTAFWEPLGIVYNSTGDEKYAKEWIFEVRDWIKKNKQGSYTDEKDFAWKAFVVSFRLNHWSSYFNMFLNSPNFTPAFLMEFLNSYNEQAEYVLHNYTDVGNHRLYEALHMMYAGSFFPEMKEASAWRKSGIVILNEEIQKQLLPDGVQFELSPSYHIGTIKIFLDALQIAQLNGIEKEFPESYSNLVEKMVLAVGKYSFPDYTFPLYGNSFLTTKSIMLKNYQIWKNVFPKNETIKYFASDYKSGTKPAYLSSSLPNAGFYAFRNGWDTTATVMQIKAGPPAEFHSHPDNGNFVLWIKGRNFTPDSGSFVYANVGDQENSKRDWYRSTKAHQTLTLDNQNITNKAKVLEWQPDGNTQILSYSNPSYTNLNHERTFLFIDNTFFLIIDRAIGNATGNVAIRYNLKEDSKATSNSLDNSVSTHYEDGNNLLIQVVNKDKITLKEESSFVSYQYQKETKRPAFAFEKIKSNEQTQGFISLLLPFDGQKAPVVKIIENPKHNLSQGKIDLNVSINGKERHIKKDLVY